MQIKIGNKTYNAEHEPILLILSEDDKKNIQNMKPEAKRFCVYPEKMDQDLVRKFMSHE